jgi:hypothetical protein
MHARTANIRITEPLAFISATPVVTMSVLMLQRQRIQSCTLRSVPFPNMAVLEAAIRRRSRFILRKPSGMTQSARALTYYLHHSPRNGSSGCHHAFHRDSMSRDDHWVSSTLKIPRALHKGRFMNAGSPRKKILHSRRPRKGGDDNVRSSLSQSNLTPERIMSSVRPSA